MYPAPAYMALLTNRYGRVVVALHNVVRDAWRGRVANHTWSRFDGGEVIGLGGGDSFGVLCFHGDSTQQDAIALTWSGVQLGQYVFAT